MHIHAALLRAAHQPWEVTDLSLDDPGPGEVRVKIAASGVCHSDHHLASGATQHPMPVVGGHEGAGVVEAVGAGVRGIQEGDHVVLNWAPYCGHCFYCEHGKPNLCDTFIGPIWAGTMMDGTTRLHDGGREVYAFSALASFADYAVVPQESCVVIRRDAPLDIAALVGCAVATGVGAAMFTAGVRPGESVVVLGCGGVGLSIIQGAQLCGAETIIAVDTNQAKMTLARKLGATRTLINQDELVESIHDLTHRRGADHVFEAVGVPALQELALQLVRPGGTVVLAGLSAMGSGTNLPGAVITRKEISIKGSYYGTVNPHRDFPLLIDLYLAGRLKLDEMISRRYRLGQINEAFETMLKGEVARGVIVFD